MIRRARRGVISLVLAISTAVLPITAAGQTDAAGRYGDLVDKLRAVEKSAQNTAVLNAIRQARRALDLADEESQGGQAAEAEKQVASAVAALDAVSAAASGEPESVQSAIREVVSGLKTTSTPRDVNVLSGSVETANGLHVVTFDTLQGTVTVNLPDDMAAGDTISGTVIAEPKGQTADEKAKNEDTLNGVVVQVADQQTPASSQKGKWIVPAAALAAIPLVLRDRGGREIGKVSVPVAKAVPPSQQPATGFQVPATGQTGRPVEIKGAFDGDFGTSSVKVGGKNIDVLAESPRKLVAKSPTDVVGVTDIEVTKRDVVQKCEFHNISIKLSAPTTNLKSGQTTLMTVTVEGLSGLTTAFPVSVVNRSPHVVKVAQGDMQTIQVDPSKAQKGTFVATRTLTGVMPGGFNISASIPPRAIPSTTCTPVHADIPGIGRPNIPATANDRPVATLPNRLDLTRHVSDLALTEPPDDPEEQRTATLLVHTGLEWKILSDERRVTTYRENPPMTGVLDLTPGWMFRTDADSSAPTTRSYWTLNANYQAWFASEHKLTTTGRTFRDDLNPDGVLSVAAAGSIPDEAHALQRIRFHSNGLILEPGVPVDVRLQRRALGAAWNDVGTAFGTVVLDPSTIVVGIAIAIIREPNTPLPDVDRSLAERWIDGRGVYRRLSSSTETRSSGLVLDRDLHRNWTVDHLDDPRSVREEQNRYGQDPDRIWSQCGRYGKNIQFRLVRFGIVDSDVPAGTSSSPNTGCRNPSSVTPGVAPSVMPYCISGWGAALRRQTGNTQPAIDVAITKDYPQLGRVAEAWRTGTLFPTGTLMWATRVHNVLAHEIGHVLGFEGGEENTMFIDGWGGIDNLMAGGGEQLTREQCSIAYEHARNFAVSGPVR
ncbi:MAG TPA: hypothetical protein VLV78_20365 [Thermoanaerobaculia bacterium]|nr:hypothetical protein [Thermoanaerobaculia bacterium]